MMKYQMFVLLFVVVSCLVTIEGSRRNDKAFRPRACRRKCRRQREEFVECKRNHTSECQCASVPNVKLCRKNCKTNICPSTFHAFRTCKSDCKSALRTCVQTHCVRACPSIIKKFWKNRECKECVEENCYKDEE